METEEKVKELMTALNLDSKSLPFGYNEQDELLKAIKIRLRVHGLVPEQDATFWAEEILLYLKFLNENRRTGSTDANFKWYGEAHKEKRRNERLQIVLFFVIVVIIALIFY